MKKFQLGVLAALLAELALFIYVGVEFGIVWVILALIAGWVLGIALLLMAGQQAIEKARGLVAQASGRLEDESRKKVGRPSYTLVSALLMLFPGIISSLAGLLLLLPPLQAAVSKRWGSAAPKARPYFGKDGFGTVVEGHVLDGNGTGQNTSGQNGQNRPGQNGPGQNRPGQNKGPGSSPNSGPGNTPQIGH